MIVRIVITALVIACAGLSLAAYGSAATDRAAARTADSCARTTAAAMYPTAADAATMSTADREFIAASCRGR